MAKNELDNAGKYNNSMAPNKSNPRPIQFFDEIIHKTMWLLESFRYGIIPQAKSIESS